MSSSSKAGKSRKQKKVQTRIAFAPVDEPSPPAEKASPSPARVVYESPKRSSIRAPASSSARSTSSRASSTPRKSQAQISFTSVAHAEGDSDDDGVPEGKKFAVVIRTQAANSSSPAKSGSSSISDNKQRKPATFMPKASKPKKGSKLQNIITVDSSDERSESEDEEEEAPLKKTPNPAAKTKPVAEESEDEDEDEEPILSQTPRLAGRRKPSYLTDSDEEPLQASPKAVVRADGRVVIPGEKTPEPSPPPDDFVPQKNINSRSFIAGGQLGQARYKDDYKRVVVRGAKSNSPEKKTKKKDVIILPSDESSSDDEPPKTPASSRKKATPHKNKEAEEDSYDSEPAGYMLEHQAERAGAKGKVFGTKVTHDVGPSGTPYGVADDDEEDVSIVKSPIKRLQKSSLKSKKPEPPVDSDSEEERIIPTPAKKRRLSPPPITDDEEDDLPIQPTPARAKSGKKRSRSSSSESDLPVAPPPGNKNKRRKPSAPTSDNDVSMVNLDSDDDDSLFSSRKGSPKKKVAPVAPMMVKATERARVDKKTKDKGNSKARADKETIAASVRSSQPKKHRTPAEKARELMRRRRNGEKITELTDTSDDSDDGPRKMGMYGTDSEVEVLDHFDDEEEEEVNQEVIRKSLLPQNKNKHKDDDDEDDFVVEDDDEPLGVPGGLHDIPIEFTNQAHKKLSEHFKDAVEWMVQRRLNPGFQRNDPVYLTAFRKLEDDPKGLVSSKLVSTVWNAKFTRALYARPDYQEVEIGASGEGKKCDACNRGKHPVSWMVTLGGKPYDEKTLEEVDQSDNEDESSDSEDSNSSKVSKASKVSDTIDSKGNRLPHSKKQWYLGSTCRQNAAAAHGLIHWKHFLDEWVLDSLQVEGFCAPEQLAERALWKKKKLDQLSMDVVDEWTDKKTLKGLFREWQLRIEQARNLENTRYGNK